MIYDRSEQINELATSLSKAQLKLDAADKSTKGYGYNYSDLNMVIKTAKPVLGEFGLSVSQLVGSAENGHPTVTTLLMHSSGQFISGTAQMPPVDMKGVTDAQRIGASISYLRRYALQAILGMASEDNDASAKGFVSSDENVSDKPKPAQKFRSNKAKIVTDEL